MECYSFETSFSQRLAMLDQGQKMRLAVGVVLFVMIALIAVVLHKFVGWLESIGAPYYVTSSLKVMEVGLFVVDVALFTLFVAKEVVILVLRMMRSH
jgi:hypothetical protein